jgi:hypothetical protein
MESHTVTPLAFTYRRTHERVLKIVEDLSEEQFFHRAAARAHAIAFAVWHLARWADHLQAHLPAMNADIGLLLGERQEVWTEEGLAQRWGFTAGGLGYDDTGMLLDDADAATLPFPSKEDVLDYARRAFAAADEAVSALDNRLLAGPNEPELRQLTILNPDARVTVADAVLTHVTHDNRHLGEIECLRGLLGLRGTATQ